MNRNFGKLNLGGIEYGPDTLTIDGRKVYNPQAVHYRIAGYLPVIDEMPETPPAEGWHYEPRGWELRPDSSAPSGVYRVYVEVQDPPPPPRVFVTADLVEALMAEGVWEQARAWIVEQGMLDLVLATKEFDETNENFQAGKTALQTALGWTDADVEELLAKCVKEGY